MPAQTYTPLEMIERLIAFDTTSRLSNLALIDFIADYLAGHGVESTKVFDTSGEKANLYATLGPEQNGGVVLSGHTDVVPVDGQEWASDPFTLSRRGDKLYGRGTADMKSFSAIALALVPDFLARGLDSLLRRPRRSAESSLDTCDGRGQSHIPMPRWRQT